MDTTIFLPLTPNPWQSVGCLNTLKAFTHNLSFRRSDIRPLLERFGEGVGVYGFSNSIFRHLIHHNHLPVNSLHLRLYSCTNEP